MTSYIIIHVCRKRRNGGHFPLKFQRGELYFPPQFEIDFHIGLIKLGTVLCILLRLRSHSSQFPLSLSVLMISDFAHSVDVEITFSKPSST